MLIVHFNEDEYNHCFKMCGLQPYASINLYDKKVIIALLKLERTQHAFTDQSIGTKNKTQTDSYHQHP